MQPAPPAPAATSAPVVERTQATTPGAEPEGGESKEKSREEPGSKERVQLYENMI